MRNGQQKRMRGRNNNRRSSNPLTRVYESNGPDVKVRGTAHHVAEKYQQLARDAQASGDPVAAENYFQHAEHYLRLIASLQGQFGPQPGFGRDEEGDDEDMGEDVGALDAPQPFSRSEQPYQPREAREPREQREQREPRQPREGRNGYRRNRDEDGEAAPAREGRDGREYRGARSRSNDAGEEGFTPRPPRAPRAEARSEEEGERPERPERPARPARSARGEEEQVIGLPSFITGGAPAKERTERAAETVAEEGADGAETAEAGDARLGRRRRRYRSRAERPEGAEDAVETAAEDKAGAEAQQALFND